MSSISFPNDQVNIYWPFLSSLLGGCNSKATTANPPKSDETKMVKKCSTDQRFIRKRNTTYKVGTLLNWLFILSGYYNMEISFKSFLGIGVCFLSSLFMCSSNALVKHLKTTSPVTISCLRFFYIWLMAQPVSLSRLKKESPFPKEKRLLLITRGILGAINNAVKYWAFQVST